MKRIAILGSTGSIGTQALNVIRRHRDLFEVEVLCAGSNADLLVRQAMEFLPNAVVIADKGKYNNVCEALANTDIKVFAGEESMVDLMEMPSIDMVLAAIVGFAGLKPTLRAVESGKPIALANKETMVVAGAIVTAAAARHRVPILPVDSEHSAIFQCLIGECSPVDKILLTASGGPFRGMTRDQLATVTLDQALHHPNWSMGRKVTIDSSTMMNKGFEVIEARWLFDIPAERIKVVVHPESVIHSMVEFEDGAVIAQMATPDMRQPIGFALSFPSRITVGNKKLDFGQIGKLSFYDVDTDRFPCLALAYEAIKRGGNAPCALNSANEVAVDAFLNGRIGFYDIARLCEKALDGLNFVASPSLDDIFATHREVADITRASIH